MQYITGMPFSQLCVEDCGTDLCSFLSFSITLCLRKRTRDLETAAYSHWLLNIIPFELSGPHDCFSPNAFCQVLNCITG